MKRGMLAVTIVVTASLAATTLDAQTAIPANGHATAGGWECDRGFRQAGSACEAIRVPENAQIDTAGHGWECNRGFKPVGDGCERLVIPANARLDTLGHDWVCNRGYRAQAESCVAISGAETSRVPAARPAPAPSAPPPAPAAPRTAQRRSQPPPLPPRAPDRPALAPGGVDSRNWAACSEVLEELTAATDEAGEQVSAAAAARDEYQQCRDGGGGCATERSEYETAQTEATRLLTAMRTKFRSAAQTCGITP